MLRKILFTAVFFVIGCGVFGTDACAEASRFGYTVRGSSLTVFVTDGGKSDYRLSMDGGQSYFSVKMPFTILSLPEGTYQLRVMYGDGGLSEVKPAVIGKSGIEPGNEIFTAVSAYAEEVLGGGSISVRIKNYDDNKNYFISIDGGQSWRPASGEETLINGLASGVYSVDVRCAGEPSLASRRIEVAVPVRKLSGSAALRVPLIKQLPELPTGCEVTSLAMAINHYGIKISKTVLADVFLEKGEYRASDYRRVFVGDPREVNAYGCYADVIKKCADKFLATIPTRSFDVTNVTGCTPQALYAYTDMGYPVIVWVSNKMLPTFEGPSWTDSDTGKTVTWTGNEHCVLLTGYDLKRKYVYMNDPLYGIVSFKMEDFETRFYELEQQAIVIAETTDK
ncbi:MAG: C39 family peptidase [Huintestinicola sp.]|uniref:C39 family peptidase n=1 Tax=Huintestinicola sp. TaxID=2981661 RepID=UPI003EFF5D27